MENVKERVLVLCTGNSCRSQMAEGWITHLYGDRVEAHSAGHQPLGFVLPEVIQVMGEVGIDMSSARSKHMNEFLSQQFDRVLTVCDHANEVCPVFPGKAERLHRDFCDPSRVSGDEPVRLAAFRKARDEIRAWVQEVFGSS